MVIKQRLRVVVVVVVAGEVRSCPLKKKKKCEQRFQWLKALEAAGEG